jgi:hypothetical protein
MVFAHSNASPRDSLANPGNVALSSSFLGVSHSGLRKPTHARASGLTGPHAVPGLVWDRARLAQAMLESTRERIMSITTRACSAHRALELLSNVL